MKIPLIVLQKSIGIFIAKYYIKKLKYPNLFQLSASNSSHKTYMLEWLSSNKFSFTNAEWLSTSGLIFYNLKPPL